MTFRSGGWLLHYYCSGMGRPVLFWMEKETTTTKKGLLLMVPKRAGPWCSHREAPGSVGRQRECGESMSNDFDLVSKGRNG